MRKTKISEKEMDTIYESTPEGKAKIDQLESAIELLARQKKNSIVVPVYEDYVKFIITGDWHLGSLYERLDVIDSIYKVAKERKIKHILHTGDLFDGHKIYKGQEFEVHQHGWDRQKKWALKNIPDSDEIKVHFIVGNHDESMEKLAGVNVGEEWAKEKENWFFVGKGHGSVKFETANGGLIVDLIHPDGGTAYALSYKAQRIIEQLEGGNKPHILGIGHYHKAEVIPQYRNVVAIQTGTAQGQTPFMKRKPTAAHVGFWIVDAFLGKKKEMFSVFRTEFFSFY